MYIKKFKLIIIFIRESISHIQETYIDLGFTLGIGGYLLYDDERGQRLQEAVKRVPLSSLLAETDATYVLPDLNEHNCTPKKPRKLCNSSLILPAIIEKIAHLRCDSLENVENAVYQNTLRTFRLNSNQT